MNTQRLSISFSLDGVRPGHISGLLTSIPSIYDVIVGASDLVININAKSPSIRALLAKQLVDVANCYDGFMINKIIKIEFPKKTNNRDMVLCVDIINDFFSVCGVADFGEYTSVYIEAKG